MKRFEYLTEHTNAQKTIDLNSFGKEGWELVSVVLVPNEGALYFFKRQYN
jgi:hypothetical protein